MKNHVGRCTALIAMLSVCFVMALVLTPIVAQSDFGQETIDAAVASYFTQTALAYEDLIASATQRPEYNATQTVISAFQSTVDAVFRENVFETARAQETAIITTAESLAADLSITSLNADSPNILAPIYSLPLEAPVTDAEFSPSSHWLAVGYETGDIDIVDMQTGESVRTLAGDGAAISALMFSPDEHLLASASVPITGGVFSPVTIRIWDYNTGQQLHVLYEHGVHEVGAMVFSSDGLHLVTVGADGTGLVWNTLTGERLYTLETDIVSDYHAVAYFKYDAEVWIFDTNDDVYIFKLPDEQGQFYRYDDPTIAEDFSGFRWDITQQRDFYTRRGSLLYNLGYIRTINSNTVRPVTGVLFSIDEANTMMAVVREADLHIFSVLTGTRAEVAAEATATILGNLTATAVQIERDETATAQAIATSRAATLAAAELDDCPGTIIEGKGDILRIIRLQPDLDVPVIGAIRAGSEIEVISRVENEAGLWYEITENNRRLGFVQSVYVFIDCE